MTIHGDICAIVSQRGVCGSKCTAVIAQAEDLQLDVSRCDTGAPSEQRFRKMLMDGETKFRTGIKNELIN